MYQSAFEYLISLLTTSVAFGSIGVFLLTFFFRLGETYQIFSHQRRKISIYLITKKKKLVPTNKTNHTGSQSRTNPPPPPLPNTPLRKLRYWKKSFTYGKGSALFFQKDIGPMCRENVLKMWWFKEPWNWPQKFPGIVCYKLNMTSLMTLKSVWLIKRKVTGSLRPRVNVEFFMRRTKL